MSPLVAFLLLWGFTLGPATEAATAIKTQPSLWAEPESLLEPWAKVTLICQPPLESLDFQLLKDGAVQELVHVDMPATKYQFMLGAVTSDNRGLYYCQSTLGSSDTWTEPSNPLEVTGAEPLPPPWLSMEPVSWITPGLNTTLLCQGIFRGVTFLLRREGDSDFLKVAETEKNGQAIFPIHQPGNYSCSYRTHAAGHPSESSTTVNVQEHAAPPKPVLNFFGHLPQILPPNALRALVCVAPLSGVEFQLRRGEEELRVSMSSTSPDRIMFDLNLADLGDHGPFTCRYRLRSKEASWSPDSAPLEIMWSDRTLPAPVLAADPTTNLHPAPGSTVLLRCTAPRTGLRFALQRHKPGQDRLLQLLKPTGTEAIFQLREVSVADSANYSCVYMELESPYAGSLPSASLELRVDGPPPRPQLRALWTGPVPAGRKAILRCEGHVPEVTFELFREGEKEPLISSISLSTSTDLVLAIVGPQHTGNYSCRYSSLRSGVFQSELSDPVELRVAGN